MNLLFYIKSVTRKFKVSLVESQLAQKNKHLFFVALQ